MFVLLIFADQAHTTVCPSTDEIRVYLGGVFANSKTSAKSRITSHLEIIKATWAQLEAIRKDLTICADLQRSTVIDRLPLE